MKPFSKIKRIYLVHWNATEAKSLAGKLQILGYQIFHELRQGTNFLKDIESAEPLAIVISLSRLPAQGRDIALMIRKRKGTRFIPIVFLGGDNQKVRQIRALLPDAHYATLNNISSTLENAVKHVPQSPIIPESIFDGYKEKNIIDKLGIKSNTCIVLINEPAGFRNVLINLPMGVVIKNAFIPDAALIICFVKSEKDLKRAVKKLAEQIRDQYCWIAWPKKSSGYKSDLSQTVVRKAGLSAGLVDFKICSIDNTWSGLLFTKRK